MTLDGATKHASGYDQLALQGAHELQINNTNKKEAIAKLKLNPGKDKQAELKFILLDEQVR